MNATEDGYLPSLVEGRSENFVVLSGCSSGGKSALLAELGARGHLIFEEPGRQIVKEQLAIGGDALPWADAGKFAELAVSRSMHNMIQAAREGRLAFFDRGILDQVGGMEHLGMAVPAHFARAAQTFRYARRVFFMPPWREIFRSDAERRHSFDDAAASYAPLVETYRRHGHEVIEVPKLDVAARANIVTQLAESFR
jgi:predicted ATPase